MKEKEFNPTIDDVEAYLKKYQRRGKAELEAIRANAQFLDILFKDEDNRITVKDDYNRCITLMGKALKENLTVEERVELNYISVRLDKLAKRLSIRDNTRAVVIEKMKTM